MNNETSYFLFQIISFKKYFCVSLGNIFYCFCGDLVVEALGSCPVCPPLNPALRAHYGGQQTTTTTSKSAAIWSPATEVEQERACVPPGCPVTRPQWCSCAEKGPPHLPRQVPAVRNGLDLAGKDAQRCCRRDNNNNNNNNNNVATIILYV